MIVFYGQERNVDVRTRMIEKVKMYEAAMKNTPSSRVKRKMIVCLKSSTENWLKHTRSKPKTTQNAAKHLFVIRTKLDWADNGSR